MKILLTITTILLYFTSFSNGIIIADEQKQKAFFDQATKEEIINFADELLANYKQVIIHLGRDFVFRKGNIYSSEKSKQNLKLFCDAISNKKGLVYLWMFDSFGASDFEKLYTKYKPAADENIDTIKTRNIYFDGLVVDAEWINLGEGNNLHKFTEMITYIKSLTKAKPVFYFASLIDSEVENLKRGYDTEKLEQFGCKPIIMLYIKDGGYKIHRNNLIPEYSNARINSLVKFYFKKKWQIAYSMEDILVYYENEKAHNISIEEFNNHKKNTKSVKLKKQKWYSIETYHYEKKDTKLYRVKINLYPKIRNYFVWEYYSLEGWLSD